MPRGVKKENLPSKICVSCGRPFTWRKKWERVWDEVTTCSKSCNRKRKSKGRDTNKLNGNNVEQSSGSETTELDSLAADFLGINVDGSLVAANSADAKVEGDEATPSDTNADANDNTALQIQPDSDEQSQTSSACSNSIIFDDQQSALLSELRLPLSTASSTTTTYTAPNSNEEEEVVVLDAKAQRKAEKKRKKAERRAQRQGKGDPTAGQKQCTLCHKSVNLLIRCTYDESGEWVSPSASALNFEYGTMHSFCVLTVLRATYQKHNNNILHIY